MKLTIVVPAFNEEKTISQVIRDIKASMKRSEIAYEIIVVNDGSTDKTSALAKKEGVIVLDHPYNKGYGASLKHGARNANGEYVLYIDADGQHDTDDILKIIADLDTYDMIVGTRTKATSLLRSPAKKIIAWFANYLAERKIPDLNSGFRAIRKDVIMRYLHLLPDTFSFTTTITLAAIKGGYNVKYVPITIRKRAGGKSTIHPIKDTLRFFVLMLRMTMLFSPLRVFLPVSFFLFLCGLSLSAYEIVKYFSIGSLSITFFISAIFIFCFGLLADQISQIRRTQ